MTITIEGPLPDELTYGQVYDPLSAIETEQEATEYLGLLVERLARVMNISEREAKKIERYNIGYWTGYLSDEAAERIKRLFHLGHPIFDAEEEE